jgi:hypothetical protein
MKNQNIYVDTRRKKAVIIEISTDNKENNKNAGNT